jgi:hypothetical protein
MQEEIDRIEKRNKQQERKAKIAKKNNKPVINPRPMYGH